MTKLLFTLITFIFHLQTFANLDTQEILNRIISADGKVGTPVSNSERRHSEACIVKIHEGPEFVSVRFEGTNYDFLPFAVAYYDQIEAVDENTITIANNSDRPRGNICGGAGGLFAYKEYITITESEIKLQRTYRCLFQLFKKYDFYTRCIFNKVADIESNN